GPPSGYRLETTATQQKPLPREIHDIHEQRALPVVRRLVPAQLHAAPIVVVRTGPAGHEYALLRNYVAGQVDAELGILARSGRGVALAYELAPDHLLEALLYPWIGDRALLLRITLHEGVGLVVAEVRFGIQGRLNIGTGCGRAGGKHNRRRCQKRSRVRATCHGHPSIPLV